MAEDEAGAEAEETLSEAFWAVARQLRQLTREALAPWDVTPAQFRALGTLVRHGPMRLSELSEQLRIAPRSATEVVDALQERGLVERRSPTRTTGGPRWSAHRPGHRGRHRDPGRPRRRGRALLRPAPGRRPRRPGPHPAHPARLTQALGTAQVDPVRVQRPENRTMAPTCQPGG